MTLLAGRTRSGSSPAAPPGPSRAAAGLAGDGCCVFNGAEAAPLKICRREQEGGVDVVIGRAVLTSLGTAGICSAACQSPELAGAAARIARFFLIFLIFFF